MASKTLDRVLHRPTGATFAVTAIPCVRIARVELQAAIWKVLAVSCSQAAKQKPRQQNLWGDARSVSFPS